MTVQLLRCFNFYQFRIAASDFGPKCADEIAISFLRRFIFALFGSGCASRSVMKIIIIIRVYIVTDTDVGNCYGSLETLSDYGTAIDHLCRVATFTTVELSTCWTCEAGEFDANCIAVVVAVRVCVCAQRSRVSFSVLCLPPVFH